MKDAITRLAATNRRILKELAAAEAESVKRIVEMAKEDSSGPYSLPQLAKMGHPYALRAVRLRLPPNIINAQTGVFRDAWQGKPGAFVSGVMTSHVVNESKVAAYLKAGTNKMIARPIDEAVMKKYAPERRRRLNEAMKRAL